MILLMATAFAGCGSTDQSGAGDEPAAGDVAESELSLEELDAETVSGERFTAADFSDYDLTMVNIWATWCGPCVGEMPDLQKVYEKLPDGVNMITICTDAAYDIDACNEVLADCGATFTTLVGNDEMSGGLLSFVEAYPTTVYVDSSGKFVGKSVVGSASDIFYLSEIDARLAKLK